jgi:hypothetical protein
MSRHLAAFQSMVRLRTPASYVRFWSKLGRDYNHCKKQSRDILDYFFSSERILGPKHLTDLPERSLDICLTSALQVTTHWSAKTIESIEVIHDSSSVMAKEKWMWDAITSPHLPPVKFATAELEGSFPLRITKTSLSDSKECLQLQFADILAGASGAWARSSLDGPVDREYSDELVAAGIAEHLIGGIWPAPNVEAREPKPGSLSASEYIDFVADVLRDASNER